GYATGAFVAASVLHSRYGLDRGFDTFGDDMGESEFQNAHADPQRRGDSVTDDALAWLNKVKGEKFFAWLHYYDPHHPYDPPGPFRNALPTPYDGEIAFMDRQIKRVVDWLDSQKLTERTLIVLVGDHGEAFGEHGEFGHTIFMYDTNLHVPMLFVHPNLPKGRRIDTIVEVVDVFPTVLGLLGWAPPEGLLSRSLAAAIRGSDLPPIQSYSEGQHVNWSYGWAEQRSLTTERWKYISSTRPELYDRSVDPNEQHSVIETYPGVAQQMREALIARYNEMIPGEAGAVVLSENARRELESLGYLSGGTAAESQEFITAGAPDPKDMLDVFGLVKRGRAFLSADQPEEAIPLLEEAAAGSPMSMSIHYLLGSAYQEVGRHAEAVVSLQAALKLDPEFPSALSLTAKSLVALNRHEEAIKHYQAALKLDPLNAWIHGSLGQVLRQAGHTDEALVHLRLAIETEPNYAEVLNELGIMSEQRGDTKEAVDYYRRAAEQDHVQGLFNLAMMLLRGGNYEEAQLHLRRVVTLKPKLAKAVLKRAGGFAKGGKIDAARSCLEAIVDSENVAGDARFNLALIAAHRGDRAASVQAYERVLESDPSHEKAVSALLNLYLSAKQTRDAVDMLRAAVAKKPESLTLLRPLASLLATAPQDDLRDGTLAVELAERAANLTHRKDPSVLATLAAAYAETGQFDRAVRIATEAIELARQAKKGRLADFVEMQLTGYRAGRPFRDDSL
ncbi:MAG: tetratricopeptide repeat protein, partial [Candidatus Binatia bacterium]